MTRVIGGRSGSEKLPCALILANHIDQEGIHLAWLGLGARVMHPSHERMAAGWEYAGLREDGLAEILRLD